MNEELIKQCARDGAAAEHGSRGFDGIAKDFLAGENDETVIVGSAMHAIRLYDAHHVAPIRQENAELRALVAELTEQTKADGERIGRLEAKVAPLVEAAERVCASYGDDPEIVALSTALAPFQQAAPTTVTKAAADVLAERRRQIEAEGWTPEHDDGWVHGELARAAAGYAEAGGNVHRDIITDFRPSIPFGWPWSPTWWKPTDRRRDLVKAGALILAEIERLDRAAALSALAEADGPYIGEARDD